MRRYLIWILFVLLIAAALRVIGLTHLPAGLSGEEVHQLSIAQSARDGIIASFYRVGEPPSGREGLFGMIHAATSTFFGGGLLPTRALSVFSSLIGVALTYALGRRLFGGFAGLIAAISAAVTLYLIISGRSVTPEAIAYPLITAALLLITQSLHIRQHVMPDPPQVISYAAMGFIFAMVAYTHWAGVFIIPIYGVYLTYLIRTKQRLSRRAIGHSGFALLIMLIALIPYLGFTLRAFDVSGLGTLWALRPDSLWDLIGGIFRSVGSLAVYGDTQIWHNLPGAALLNPVGFVLLLVGVIETVRHRTQPNYVLILMPLVTGLAIDAWTRGDADFSHQVLALPAIMTLIGAGAAAFAQYFRESLAARQSNLLIFLSTLGIAAAATYAAGDLLFRVWANRPEAATAYQSRLGRLANFLDRNPQDQSTSICSFQLDPARGMPSDPELLALMLHRKTHDLRYSNCISALVLTRGGETQRFAYANPQGQQAIAPPLQTWLQNARVLHAPGLPRGTVLEVDASSIVADDFGQVIQSAVEFAPETAELGPLTAQLPLRMGGYLTFEGYRLDAQTPYRAGDEITLITYWRADGEQVPGLRLFAHLSRNPDIEPALQNDILGIEASLLRDRDVFIQIISLPLPADFPSGEYFLSIGAYSDVNAQRLPIYDGEQERGNRLFLGKVTVQ
ncbi:MAG: hypothetical protein OHK0023_23560 [Anaerolineae bacterium]